MKNKWFIVIVIVVLGIISASAYHMYNSGKYMEGNSIHNMMMGGKMKMNNGETYEHHGKLDDLPEAKKSEIVELKDGDIYEMTASIVKQEVGNRIVKRLAYNGMIPGPLLKVEKGSKIKLKLTNNLDIETTLHSHGLRLDESKFDGLPTTMGGEQKPMKSGESFTYELNFPDTGVFWYHPHIREDYTQEMGLYGNFAVTEEGYWGSVDREEYLILDDFSEDDIFYKDKVNKTLMGRFGNIMMINNDENYTLKVKTGEKVRLFLTNVANTRTFDFSISPDMTKFEKENPLIAYNPDKLRKWLKIVGGDIGRIEKEFLTKNQTIAPAERYIAEIVFDNPGTYIIYSKGRRLGKIIVKDSIISDLKADQYKKDLILKNPQAKLNIVQLTNEDIIRNITNNSVNMFLKGLRKNSEDYKNIRNNINNFLSKKADKKLRLTIGMKGMKGMKGGMGGMDGMKQSEEEIEGIEWEDDMARMNEMSNDKMIEWRIVDEETKNENMNINWRFKKGDFVKVEIYNDPKSMHPMQHPVHFHGQRFVVLTRDGKVNDNLQWKDTTLVQNGEKIEILIEMTNPGLWMSHCHIAEHLQSGMMMNFRVEE